MVSISAFPAEMLDLDRLALAQRMQLSQMRPTGVVGNPFAKGSKSS